MKKQLLLFALILLVSGTFAQTTVESLIQKGIGYHDNGQYDLAIKSYKEALKMEPQSPLINYEMALTYMSAGEYENCIKHADKVIKLNDLYLLEATIAKGSSLDNLGKTKESIKLFIAGLKKYGDHYLLYYNLALNYYKIEELDNAEEALINGIHAKSNHASSHLLLGYIMVDKKQKVQSILCLHNFLFLEPNSERAKLVYPLMREQMDGNVKKNGDEGNEITIFLDPSTSDSEFGAAELMLGLLGASSSLEENEGKSEEEMFTQNTTSFFTVLGELKNKKHNGLWWDHYVTFFYEIAKSEHMDAYCNYISQAVNPKAVEWMKENEDKLKDFGDWLK